MRNTYKILVGKPQEKSSLRSVGVDGRILLRWIARKEDERMWNRFIWFRIWSNGRLLWTW
jgi:hypothetical protein